MQNSGQINAVRNWKKSKKVVKWENKVWRPDVGALKTENWCQLTHIHDGGGVPLF